MWKRQLLAEDAGSGEPWDASDDEVVQILVERQLGVGQSCEPSDDHPQEDDAGLPILRRRGLYPGQRRRHGLIA
jgi:hypothetical protein